MQDRIRKLAEWMGWEEDGMNLCFWWDEKGCKYHPSDWNPFERIQDAWMLVERAEKRGYVISFMDQLGYDEEINNYKMWRVEFMDLRAHERGEEDRDKIWLGVFQAPTAPEAICAAIEKLMEEGKEKMG
jgi:hypothetical protein